MDRFILYVKRLVSFCICALLFVIFSEWISVFILAPLLILAFSLLHSRITSVNPPHLFAFYRTEKYFHKGGLRDFLRIPLILIGIVYDVVLWFLWGNYLAFILLVDLLDFIKNILYRIVYAFIWFCKQYAPFFVFLSKIFVHYFIRWPWWLYQISFYNMRYAFNRNCYRVALTGTILAGFIIFFFFFLEINLENVPGVSVIGIVLALLPISWSFGEIANIRTRQFENETYTVVKQNFQNGIESLRSILFYTTVLVVLLLVEGALNLLGWLQNSGAIWVGLTFSINTLLSIAIVALCILIVFGTFVIPSYRLYHPFSEMNLAQTLALLKAIGKKFHQYIVLSIPLAFFSIIVMILPVLFALLVYFISYSLKNSVVEVKINKLRTEIAITDTPLRAYQLNKEITRLQEIQQFPEGLFQEYDHLQILSSEMELYKDDAKALKAEILLKSERFATSQKIVNDSLLRMQENPSLVNVAHTLKNQLGRLTIEQNIEKSNLELQVGKAMIDMEYLARKINRLPIFFLLGGLWLVLFGGLVFSFAVAYSGNVYHQVFVFRNDVFPSLWHNAVWEQKAKDSKQPLLGGTLLVITCIVAMYILMQWPLKQSIQEFIDRLPF